MELLAKPGVGGIIEKRVDRTDFILIQDRYKDDAKTEAGLLEIPAGKIREFENIYECLRREIREETGLVVTHIEGEDEATVVEGHGYAVLSYTPFACSQNTAGSYPILVQTFICRAEGELLSVSNESKNIRWISAEELAALLDNAVETFYPMHVTSLKKYVILKRSRSVTQ